MSYATALLEHYVETVGLREYLGDALYQFQVTLLRQWVGHLEEVLTAEHTDTDTAERIIRGFVYGCVPGAAEAEYRIEQHHVMTDMMSRLPPTIGFPGVPG